MSNPASTAVTAAETAAVDVFAGIENLFGMVKTGIESGTKVVTASNTSSVVGELAEGAENLVAGDSGAAVRAIEGFIADVEARKWGSLPHDIEACLKAGFAILARFGVNVPIASAIIAALPDIPAVA